MIIFTLDSENSEYKKILEQFGDFAAIELFEDLDFLLETISEEDCHAVLLNLDDHQKKREKDIKKIKKVNKNLPILLFSNDLDVKKIIKHQNSKVGGSAYLQTPIDTEMLKLLVAPFWDGEFADSEIAEIEEVSNSLEQMSRDEDISVSDLVFDEESSGGEATGEVELNLDNFEEEEVHFPDEDDLTFPDRELPELKGVEELAIEQDVEGEDEELLELGSSKNNLGIVMDDELSSNYVSEVNLDIDTDDLFKANESIEDELTRPAFDFEKMDNEGTSEGLDVGSEILEMSDIGSELLDEEEEDFSIDLDSTTTGYDIKDDTSEQKEKSEEQELMTKTSLALPGDLVEVPIPFVSDKDAEAQKTIVGVGIAQSLENDFDVDTSSGDIDTDLELFDNIDTDLELSDDIDTDLELSDDIDTGLELSDDIDSDLELSDDIDMGLELSDGIDTDVELSDDIDMDLELSDDIDTDLELPENNTGLDIEESLEAKQEDPILPDLIDDFKDNISLERSEQQVEKDGDLIEDIPAALDDVDITDHTDKAEVFEEAVEDEDATVVFQKSTLLNESEKTASRVAHLGAKTQTTISQDHKQYVQTHDEELIRLGETIHHLREDRENLLNRIAQIEANKDEEKYDFLNLQALLDEKKIELTVVKKRIESQNDELKTKLDISLDRRAFLEKQNKNFALEIEKLSKQKRFDMSRIHQRERELEEKLEMLRKDAEIQLRNRDQKILELKRRIDSLEFDIETSRAKEVNSVTEQLGLEEKMDSVMKTLRNAIGQLEDDQSEFEKQQLIKKNLKL